MKGTKVAYTVMAGILLTAGGAKADPGIFGEPVQLDGSLEMRQSTTEQFDPVRGQSVSDRPRPDFDAVPLSVGSFQFFPSVNLTSYMNTNIFAQDTHEDTDYIWKLNPAFSLLSNWGRNAVAVTGFGDFDYYSSHNDQNYSSGAIQAEGRWDIAHETWVATTAGYQRVVELRGDPNTPGAALGPSEYNLYQGGVEAYRGLGLLKTKLNYNVAYYDYQPYELNGGGDASQNARDRIENEAGGEASYDLTENFQPFVRAGYNWRTYTATTQHSSNGSKVDVGSKMDFGGVTTAEAYVGYLNQNYYNYTGGDISALDFGGDLLWNVTELTSVEVQAGRSIEETTQGTASSIIDSNGTLTVSHELMRNLLIEGHIEYSGLDYQNFGRHDDLYDTGFGGRYFINRNMFADATYDYQRRGSDASGENFNTHILLTRIGVQY
jgi:hypothetical protein